MMRLSWTTVSLLLLAAAVLAGLTAVRGYLTPFLPAASQSDALLEKINLPEGFVIHSYADDVPGARSMSLSPSGTLFVGTRGEGKVYAIVDSNRDFRADHIYTLAEGLNMPNGVAFHDGDLYVAEVSRILRFIDIESRLENPPTAEVVTDAYPDDEHHGWKFIAFGPDGKLYIPVGAPCNICLPEDDIYAGITRINPDGSQQKIVARGVRNTVGFDWHPETGELWFTDNGRDWLGENKPPDELNRLERPGSHFGYPYCHGGDIADPEFGQGVDCSDYTPPVQALGPHVAALGMRFYTARQFPERYRNGIFIAEHGSWNRKIPIGYRVMFVPLKQGKPASYEVFADGWLEEGIASGRPVDVQVLHDGSLLVSDDKAGRVYRIVYTGKAS